MENYVTLFDNLFLPQGLALHASMQRHIKAYVLWILCVDDETHQILLKLKLPNVKLLQLSKLETAILLHAKAIRTKGEYCWTLTPFAPKFVFEADPNVSRVTYIDADLWFRKDPSPIFQEFDATGKSVLITDHGYAPEHDQSATSGQFCVQYMIFTKSSSEEVRQWWENRCIEWCYARFEDEKFGDQKYLDIWPNLFGKKVHVLQCKEWTLAPWNATRFPYGNAIFFHFHGLRIIDKKKVEIGNFPLPGNLIKYIYQPYLNDLRAAVEFLRAEGFIFMAQAKPRNQVLIAIKKIIRALINLPNKNSLHWM
jgi:hypothetical protein